MNSFINVLIIITLFVSLIFFAYKVVDKVLKRFTNKKQVIAIRKKYWDDFKSKKDEKLKVGDDKNENDIC